MGKARHGLFYKGIMMTEDEERKMFQRLLAKDNPHFNEDAIRIYDALVEKYGDDSIKGFDDAFNILVCSLVILFQLHIEKDDYPYAIQVVHKLLTENLMNREYYENL